LKTAEETAYSAFSKGGIMEQTLNELKSVQGVTGAYIFTAKGLILANTIPGIFKPDKLQNMGKMLAKIHAAGRMNFPDISEIFLTFDESILIIREIVGKVYLIILCEPNLNINLITLSMNLIMEELKDEVESQSESSAPTAIKAVPSTQATATQTLSPKGLLASGPLSTSLQGMQAALAKFLGPMAKIIFIECIEKWLNDGPPSRQSLPNLVNIVSQEIKDADKAAGYRQMVTPFM
jgi:predicted regulator of Ras-like GTPase activity (Roadblock/LC7/MglB family)